MERKQIYYIVVMGWSGLYLWKDEQDSHHYVQVNSDSLCTCHTDTITNITGFFMEITTRYLSMVASRIGFLCRKAIL